MRQKTLSFKVDDQFIRTPCYRVVADSKNYLYARFSFSDSWQGLTKTAVFTGADGTSYHMLLEDDGCLIPAEVIKPTRFLISVFGGDRLTTDQAVVEVEASGCVDGITPPVPTPDIYTQFVDAASTERQLAQAAAVTAGEQAEQSGNAAMMAMEAEERATSARNEAYFYANEASNAEQAVRAAVAETRQHAESVAALAEDASDSADTATMKADESAVGAEQAKGYAQEAHNNKLYCEEMVSAAFDAQWNAQLSAESAKQSADAAAEAAASALTEEQMQQALSAHTSLRPWNLLEDITLTEEVSMIDEGRYDQEYDEIWVEGTMVFATDYTAAKTGLWALYFNTVGTTHTEYWGSITDGRTQYFRVHGYRSPSGALVYDTMRSNNYYLAEACRQTAGVKTIYSKFNRFCMTIGEENGSTGIRFGAGTSFKVWGR